MTTQEGKVECENQSEGSEFKHCLNFQHCQGFVGCAKDSKGKLISGYNTKRGLCTSCDHWERLYEGRRRNDVISIRVNGRHYQTALQSINKPPGKYAGFGGRKFVVRIKSPHTTLVDCITHEFYTCDMWTQGVIPEHFRDKLPDNAEFLNEVTETIVDDGEQFITAFDIGSISGREEFKTKSPLFNLKEKK